jgi:hypothetical protein
MPRRRAKDVSGLAAGAAKPTLVCRNRPTSKVTADDTRDPINTTRSILTEQSEWYVYALNFESTAALVPRRLGGARIGGGSSNCTSCLRHRKFAVAVSFFPKHMLTCCNSLSPKSYVFRSHRPHRSTVYSQPPQRTAQLWSKSKDELASQLTDLKSYVATRKLGRIWTGY